MMVNFLRHISLWGWQKFTRNVDTKQQPFRRRRDSFHKLVTFSQFLDSERMKRLTDIAICGSIATSWMLKDIWLMPWTVRKCPHNGQLEVTICSATVSSIESNFSVGKLVVLIGKLTSVEKTFNSLLGTEHTPSCIPDGDWLREKFFFCKTQKLNERTVTVDQTFFKRGKVMENFAIKTTTN